MTLEITGTLSSSISEVITHFYSLDYIPRISALVWSLTGFFMHLFNTCDFAPPVAPGETCSARRDPRTQRPTASPYPHFHSDLAVPSAPVSLMGNCCTEAHGTLEA